jgi:hypothetical protein
MFTQNKAPDDKTTALMTNKIEITTSMKNKGHVCNIGNEKWITNSNKGSLVNVQLSLFYYYTFLKVCEMVK